MDESIIYKWINKYRAYGSGVFDSKPHNSKYTKEFKQEVVEAYLTGEGSIEVIANKYNVHSDSTVMSWIKKYNNLKELKDYNPRREIYMKDCSRKTTYEERIEIVNDCLTNDKNYKGTAHKFNVSYTQVYQWVKKYENYGEEGLIDKRGKCKDEEQLSETEILQRKVKMLERLEVRMEAMNREEPEQYPIPFNSRIVKYKESLVQLKTQSATCQLG